MPLDQTISDPDDDRAAPYRDLRARDAALRRHGFVVEGVLAVERAIAAGRYPLASLLLTQRLRERLAPQIAGLDAAVAIYTAAQSVMDDICGFPVHRGVLAYARQPDLPSPGRLLAGLGRDALVVCPVGVNDPENMGAIFRNAAAFGAAAVILDSRCCDPLYRRAIRVSVGAAVTTPFARTAPGEDLPALLERHGVSAIALSPAGAEPLKALRTQTPAALLVGAEGPGLDEALLARCRTVAIPMAAGFNSLNVATALGIALHHLSPEPRG